MSDVSFDCTVHRHTTVLAVRGSVGPDRCDLLHDMLDMCRGLRDRGPIVIDLAEAGRLSPAAVLLLRQAAEDARSAGRPLRLQNLSPHATMAATTAK
jgi:anti-anti-sigma regulatory factor